MTDRKEITFDKFIRWAGVAVLVLAVLYVVNYLSSVLLPFFIAWFLAYLLYPIVKFVEDKLHVRVRALAIIITLVVVFAVLGAVIYLIVPPMIEQISTLSYILTHWVHSQTHNSIQGVIRDWVTENQTAIERFFKSKDFTDAMKTAMPKVFSFLGQTANVVISIVASMITLLYMFFILLDYEYLTDNWIRIFPVKNRPFWRDLSKDVARELNNYIRGQGLVALCMGIMFCIGFSIIDFPMAIGMGILIGILDLVPYLHTFALIPCAFLTMLKAASTGQSFLLVFGLVIGMFCIVQVITDMIVTPKIMGKAMGLNPAILLLSLSVWGALLGFIGLIIALPLTTLIMAYWQRYVTKEKTSVTVGQQADQGASSPSEEQYKTTASTHSQPADFRRLTSNSCQHGRYDQGCAGRLYVRVWRRRCHCTHRQLYEGQRERHGILWRRKVLQADLQQAA